MDIIRVVFDQDGKYTDVYVFNRHSIRALVYLESFYSLINKTTLDQVFKDACRTRRWPS